MYPQQQMGGDPYAAAAVPASRASRLRRSPSRHSSPSRDSRQPATRRSRAAGPSSPASRRPTGSSSSRLRTHRSRNSRAWRRGGSSSPSPGSRGSPPPAGPAAAAAAGSQAAASAARSRPAGSVAAPAAAARRSVPVPASPRRTDASRRPAAGAGPRRREKQEAGEATAGKPRKAAPQGQRSGQAAASSTRLRDQLPRPLHIVRHPLQQRVERCRTSPGRACRRGSPPPTCSPYRSRPTRSIAYASTVRSVPSNCGLVPTEIAAGIASPSTVQPARVDAVGRDRGVRQRLHVGRGEAQLAAALRAAHDDALDAVRPAEDLARARHVALGDQPAGQGGGERLAAARRAALVQVDDLDLVVVGRAQLGAGTRRCPRPCGRSGSWGPRRRPAACSLSTSTFTTKSAGRQLRELRGERAGSAPRPRPARPSARRAGGAGRAAAGGCRGARPRSGAGRR